MKKQFCKNGHDTFLVGRATSGGCRACKRVIVNAYAKNNLEKVNKKSRERQWKNRGMFNTNGSSFSSLDFDRLYQIQQGCCALCLKHSSEFNRRLHVDHDHKTGIVRGLLCFNCNKTLWYFEDSEFPLKVKTYLSKEIF